MWALWLTVVMRLVVVMFVGSYKIDIYWSEYPEQGRAVLITDCPKHSSGVDIPPNYVIQVVDPPAKEVFTETRVESPNLFMTGIYMLCICIIMPARLL